MRNIKPSKQAAASEKVSIRTRLKGISDTDETVLWEVGSHLGGLASADLAERCRLARESNSMDWDRRKRELTSASTARWAGAITKASNEAYSTARANGQNFINDKYQATQAISKRLKVPAGEKDKKGVKGYATEAERYLKRGRLQSQRAKLERAKDARKHRRASVVRGSKRLLKNRLHLEEAGLTEAEWRERWEASRLFLEASGETGKKSGNDCLRVEPSGAVSIRVPEPLIHLANAPNGRYILDASAIFSYRGDEWLVRAAAKKSVAYCIWYCVEKGRWYIDASFTLDEPPKVPDKEEALAEGAIGVDLNAGHLSVWRLDEGGNPVGMPRYIDLDLEGLPASTRDGHLRAAISEVLRYASKSGVKAIAVEDLGFDDARAEGRETMGRGKKGKRFRRQVSGIPTNSFRQRLSAMASRMGIAIIAVDPAYTSKWGAKYWEKPLGCSRHEAASVVIGRCGLGHGARRKVRDTPAPHQRMEAASKEAGAGHYAGRREHGRGSEEAGSTKGGPATRGPAKAAGRGGLRPEPADGEEPASRERRTVWRSPPLFEA